jgi:hypothetical protein
MGPSGHRHKLLAKHRETLDREKRKCMLYLQMLIVKVFANTFEDDLANLRGISVLTLTRRARHRWQPVLDFL